MLNGINGPEPQPAIQRSHHANDGGAGNLGYFKQEKKKKKDEDESDTLELSSKKEEEEEIAAEEKKPDEAGSKIRTFWLKIRGVFTETVSEDEQ